MVPMNGMKTVVAERVVGEGVGDSVVVVGEEGVLDVEMMVRMVMMEKEGGLEGEGEEGGEVVVGEALEETVCPQLSNI